jgi:hypothetical protein
MSESVKKRGLGVLANVVMYKTVITNLKLLFEYVGNMEK